MIRKNTGAIYNSVIELKNALYRITSGYVKIFSKMNPKEVFPTTPKSKLKTIFLLVPGDRFAVSSMGRDQLIKFLFINCEMESFPFYRYMLEYAYAFPGSNHATYWQSYQYNLNKNLPQDLSIYKIEVPREYSRESFVNILKTVAREG